MKRPAPLTRDGRQTLVYLVFAGSGPALTGVVVWAMIRRRETINVVLAVAFVAAVTLSEVRSGPALRPLLVGLDALVVAAMAMLWARYHSQRARIVGAIGMVKVGWALLAGGMGAPWHLWAPIENAAFVAQVLVAGGDGDGIANWLADRWRRFRSLGTGLLGNVGG